MRYLAVAVLVAACSGDLTPGDDDGPAGPFDLSGSWTWTAQGRNDGLNGTCTASGDLLITQSGVAVSGLLANAVAPGLLDRYLARTGYDAQQTEQPKPPDQPANLWDPADGDDGHDYGAHGRFDQKAYAHSPQAWASQHHGTVAAVGVGLVAGSIALVRAARR